ncbi:MAG: 2,5-diketo-D-gluconate reductase B [Halobacteriales archaeon]|jgi:2,5-diketo-D-gluconate reductase B
MTNDRLPPIGIGTYDMEPEVCRRSVETALNLGYRHVDTAEMYENERAIGEAIEAADVDREDVLVATKVHSKHLGYDDAIEHALESADRLGVDAIDLLYIHWPIRAYEPEDTLAAFDELYARGLIRRVGLSNFTPDLLNEALAHLDAPLAAHQVECHPLLHQDELRALAGTHDHTLVAYSPLAKGTVTEVPELVEIADDRGASPAQVSLAWLCSKDVVASPKATSEAHIRENLASQELSLTDAEIARIDGIDRTRRLVDFDGAPWR